MSSSLKTLFESMAPMAGRFPQSDALRASFVMETVGQILNDATGIRKEDKRWKLLWFRGGKVGIACKEGLVAARVKEIERAVLKTANERVAPAKIRALVPVPWENDFDF